MNEIIDNVVRRIANMENQVIEVVGVDGDTLYIKLSAILSMTKDRDVRIMGFQEGNVTHRFRVTQESWEAVLKLWRGK